MNLEYLPLYLAIILLVVLLYLRGRSHGEARDRTILVASVDAGLTDPPSLHPVVDPLRCLGSGSCAKACPEQALGIIDGKAQLVNPSACIGHGACAAACPFDAISLVIGTEKRGVELPQVGPDFQTNVPGLFIAGELGGMGLIRKAAEQGRQAMDNIAGRCNGRNGLDVIVIGAGPAGLAATLAAKQHDLRFIIIEQEDSLGGSILHYPRNKIAMTAPMKLPIIGNINLQDISKEALIDFWAGVIRKNQLEVHFRERLEQLEKLGHGFRVKTSCGEYVTSNVLLSTGRRGTPRKLGVPGEELSKVVYRLVDPAQYRNQNVLVVGGGDSAVEAALAIANENGATVTLSYRGPAFARIKIRNRERLEQASRDKQVEVLLESNVLQIERESVILDHSGRLLKRPNDCVLVCAGGVLPTAFLKSIGVRIETHHGTPLH